MGRIIRHGIGRAGNMVIAKAVAVVPLVKAGQTKKVGSGVTGGDGTAGGTTNGRGVVIEDREGAFASINRLGQNILVGDNAGEFEITIGEGTTGIVIRNKVGLDMRRERGPPKESGGAINKPHATHAGFGRIDGTDARWEVGNNFGQPGGMKVEVGSEGLEIVELGADMGIKMDTVAIRMENAGLEGAEQATATWDRQHHAAEFT